MTEVPNTLLGKVMSVLNAFGADDDELGFAELGRRTGLSKATLHRLLGDLAEVRLLDRGTRGYCYTVDQYGSPIVVDMDEATCKAAGGAPVPDRAG